MQVLQNRLLNRLMERLPDYTSLILVILCGFLLARITWMMFPAEPPLPVVTSTAPVDMSGTGAAPNPVNQLASYNLFGQYNAAPTAAPIPTAPIQNTQLALKLQGLYALPGNKGFAVIEENGQQKAYRVGKTIGNSGAVLEKVMRDHVLIRRNGALEKLALPKLSAPGGGGGDNTASMPGSSFDPGIPPVAPEETVVQTSADTPPDMPPPEMFTPSSGAIPPPPTEPLPAEPTTPINPQQGADTSAPGAEANLGTFRQSVMNNNARLLEVATPQPYEANGKFKGFQLNPGSNTAMFSKLGFQAGDIVTAINGTTLDSPATAMQLLQGASTANQVNLTITRNGQEISLPISFQ